MIRGRMEQQERKIYVCDFCNTSYNEKSKAEKCESNHKKCKEIVDVRYSPYKSDNTGRPKKICIKFDDGDNEWYSRM